MAVRKWPKEAIRDVVARGISSEDIDAARDAARRSLMGALPAGARALLYRASLIVGRFDRAMGLEVGALSPAVHRAGEYFDQLVGPWIEAVGSDSYRVSPLASNVGQQMLPSTEQEAIHSLIATQLLSRRFIETTDADVIFAHALLGKSDSALLAIVRAVITADAEALDALGEHFLLLRIARFDEPISPHNPTVSCMSRLAQFKLVAAKGDGDAIASCAHALFAEIAELSDELLFPNFEVLALSKVLTVLGIADHLPDWIDLFIRFITIVEADKELGDWKGNFERASRTEGISLYGFLFSLGATGISSVRRLEEIMEALDHVGMKKKYSFTRL